MEAEKINLDLIQASTEDTTSTLPWLPLLPLKNVVILPKTIRPVIVGRERSIKAVEEALRNDKLMFVTAQKRPDTEQPASDDIFTYGITATILQVMRMPNGSVKILIEGLSRARMLEMREADDYSQVLFEELSSEKVERNVEIEAIWRQLQSLYQEYAKLNDKVPHDLMNMVRSIEDMESITDTLAVHINISFDERQNILEIIDLKERMVKIAVLLEREIEILKTEQRIKGRIQTQVEKNQREYYLTEQIKAIQKELGREDIAAEIQEIRSSIKKVGLSKEATERVEKELKRLEQMPPLSSEAVVSRNYIDWIMSIPWKNESKDSLSLIQAEKILNKHHAGLTKAKERIIEFLAAKKYSKKLKRSPIVCLVGAPGVGKTSLGQSVAESLGREFARISLGGIRDEAEIRGHRRTYIGALPGKIIQAMKKAKTVNPVILLDEIDKISRDIHGDPASALLEVLDPEQNKTFVDHFLDVEYDLSSVMFITTANMFEGIPYPLLDRMEIINLSGYSEDEKVDIARKFLIPKKLKEHDLTTTQFKFSEKLLRTIINEYTKEAGVRQLERILAKLARKVIQELLKDPQKKCVTITEKKLIEWLGHPKFKKSPTDNLKNKVGIATGLAWTELGGDILEIEVSVLPGKGNLTLTGQLGEVMQESGQAALSYVRSRAKELGLKNNIFNDSDIHIHVPEGATPKDGPSAGITMCLALVSALTKTQIKFDLAMTGEITLRGRVLPIGGLKEKLLAARRYDKTTVLIPKENTHDFLDIKDDIADNPKIVFVDHMDEVLKHALVSDPFKRATKTVKKKAIARKKK